MDQPSKPEEWRTNVMEICKDMGIDNIDAEALNLLCFALQQETCAILKSCATLAKSSNSSVITSGHARVAYYSYDISSFLHPRSYEKNLSSLTDVINVQPLLPGYFEDPQLCSNLNLSAPPWRLSNINPNTSS